MNLIRAIALAVVVLIVLAFFTGRSNVPVGAMLLGTVIALLVMLIVNARNRPQ